VLAGFVVGLLAIAAVTLIARLAAPSDAEIIARATSRESVWRQANMVTRYSTVVRRTNPVTGEPEKLLQEHWDTYDGSSLKTTTVRVGTPRTYASIFEPDPLRVGNIAEETSSTATTNPLYRTHTVDTPQGLWEVVDTAAAAKHDSWWGPCGSCHVPKLDPSIIATAQAGLPPYLAPVNKSALKVAGTGKVAGRRTYVLEAERPSVPEGYREITRIDVDRRTYLPLRYRVEIVQDLAKAGQDVVDTTEVDITSHRLVPLSKVPLGGFGAFLPPSLAYAARQSFDASAAVTWPPPDSTPRSSAPESTRPAIYDLGSGYHILGGNMGGLRFTGPASPTASAVPTEVGRPNAVLEALHPTPGEEPQIRVVTEYGEIEPPGEDLRYGQAQNTLDNGSRYAPLLWVITLPKVTNATVRQWAGSATVTPFSVAGGPGFEIRGATIEDSLRPFDYGAVVVQMPDATVVITQPPNTPDVPVLVKDAASHLVKRQ
jgi:hypothetical protein